MKKIILFAVIFTVLMGFSVKTAKSNNETKSYCVDYYIDDTTGELVIAVVPCPGTR